MIQKVLTKIDLTTSYFIKGIVNSKEIFSDIPFKVNAKLINKNLVEKPINLKIVDNLKYSLKFKINGKEIQKFHFFDSTAITEFYNIKISLNPQINLRRIENISSVRLSLFAAVLPIPPEAVRLTPLSSRVSMR